MSIRSSFFLPLIVTVLGTLSTGCDRLGIADPVADAARKEADARATGSACRHAGRGVEDCYIQNPDAARAAVFAGWKEMNDYMRENKIEEVKPTLAAVAASSASATEVSDTEETKNTADKEKPAKKSGKKSAEH